MSFVHWTPREALFAIFVQYDVNLDGQVRGDESSQLLKAICCTYEKGLV